MRILRQIHKASIARLNQNTKAGVLGLLDISVCFSYLLAVPVPIWYAALLLGKIILLMRYGSSKASLLQVTPFIILIAISLLYTEFLEEGSFEEAFNIAGFIFSLTISVSLLRQKDILDYLYFIALLGTAIAAIYLIFVSIGLIPDHYGRLMFFNGSHPNLGGETFCMILIAALITFRSSFFLLAWLLLTSGIFLMQARAALLVALAVLGLYLWWKFQNSGKHKLLLIMTFLTGTILFVFFGWDFLLIGTENILLTSDESRGLGTGFVGREERWSQALNIFYENPFFGGGFAAFDKIGMLTPHNYFLAGISNMGMIALFMFVYLAYCLCKVQKVDRYILAAFAPLLILMIFNDRFLNMNPYPFSAYVVIFVISARAKKRYHSNG